MPAPGEVSTDVGDGRGLDNCNASDVTGGAVGHCAVTDLANEAARNPHGMAIACKQKFVLDSYEDEAVGHMEKNAEGKMAVTRVELRPKITWGGDRTPSAEQLDKMHHTAHENCFIANSVKTEVTVTNL